MSTEIYGYSLDGETYHGRYPTRAEAVAAGAKAAREERELSPGGTFTTGLHDKPPHTSEFMPSVDDVLEHMTQKAYVDYDEAADDWPDIGPDDIHDARQQLDCALNAFAYAVHSVSPPAFHYIVDEETHVVPEA